MRQYIRRASMALAIGTTMFVAGCGGDDAADSAALGADSSLSRDLQLAGADTGVSPQLQDVAEADVVDPGALTDQPAPAPAPTRTVTPPRSTTPRPTRPSTPAPRPTTSAPRPSTPAPTPGGNTETGGTSGAGGGVGSIAAGTSIGLASDTRVCTNTYAAGSSFTATVAETVTGSNGAVIPRGAKVSLTVTRAKRSENMNDPIVFEFAVNSVTFGGRTYPLSASIASANVDRVANQPASKDAQKVATGAVIGAIAGRVLGGDTKSTVIGGAVGAAAGAATAKATSNYEGCVPDGGAIRITLNDSVQIRV